MEETVGNHKPFPNRPNQPDENIKKAFMVFANLLTFEAPRDVRRHKEFIIVNNDKTFSLYQETIIPDETNGQIDHFRVRDTDRFHTTLMLCYQKNIDPCILIGIN